MSKISTFLDLSMPLDFPSDTYNEVGLRIGNLDRLDGDPRREFVGAWLAVAYRSIACVEYSSDFTELMQLSGGNPSFQEQYLQEKYLFNFFINGLSVLESTCYSLFAMGALIKPSGFPFTTPEEKRKVFPKNTKKRYCENFAGENITNLIAELVSSTEYIDWQDTRNILAHRVVPGRIISASTTNMNNPDVWRNGITLDTNTTTSRLFWLTNQLTSLITSINAFTKKYFV